MTRQTDLFGRPLLAPEEHAWAHDLQAYRSEYDEHEKNGYIYSPADGVVPRISWIMGMLCDLPRGSKILDIGCKTGEMLLPLSTLWRYELYGIDVVQRFVDACVARGLNVIQGFAENLPYGDDTFDAVVLCEILEHVLDVGIVMHEALRVLKPGGMVALSVPFGPWHLGLPPEQRDHHLREVDLRSFFPYGRDFVAIQMTHPFTWAPNDIVGTNLMIFRKHTEPPFVRQNVTP